MVGRDRGEELFDPKGVGATVTTGGLFVDLTDTGAAATRLPGVPLDGVVSTFRPELDPPPL